ncbi:MAG TPA: zinc-binding dehydrogenase [Candidatus Saccharimonadaceae bacterium]|jgi:NADPH:quinone reductase-like Zn-dependent oxidoreductase|nr:zinc-binding dehydrogenase [Candidatus Saccharimonadaceae bacterium]
MKAIVFDRPGGPEVLELRDVPEPAIAPDEALVEVRACGINHLDLWVRSGLRGLDVQMPHILGNDIVGEVRAVGAAVRHLKVGQKTLVLPTLSCGTCPACFAGDDNLCRQYDVIGRRRNGGYAERVAVPAVNCLPYPENLKWEQAAAVPLVFLTAWHMLVGRAKLRAGEDVLVIGAGSGVGSAAVQIARLLGARVLASASGRERLERVRTLGAHETIDHAGEDLAARARELTGKKGVEVVFEHVGGRVFEQGVAALARNGRLVTCGATIGGDAKLDLNALFGRHLTLMGSWMGRRSELVEVLQFVRDGRLAPVVDSVVPLADAAAAHRRIEARQHFGKVVLVP